MNCQRYYVFIITGSVLLTTLLINYADCSPVLLEYEGTQCLYGNKAYAPGEKFHPDDCTKCHCPKHGASSRPRCHVQDCQAIPRNCLKSQKRPGECCGLCLEYGCLHTDGKVYAPGQTVLDNTCNHCFCPHRGGRTVCKNHKCPRVACVDAVKESNECCPRCPNGPNCWLNGKIIPAGQEVMVSQCRKCQCPQTEENGFELSYWLFKGPAKIQAVCRTDDNCK